MRKGIYLLPNCLTLCGMFAGFFSIVSALRGDYTLAAWAIVIAGVFDGLDGWVARITRTSTKFGIQLDSLSDVIAFGVAPAVLVYDWSLQPFGRIGAAAAFMFVACGALRLARYNVQKDTEERMYFTGMPIPAAAGVVASTVLFFGEFGLDPAKSYYILAITFLCGALMVSTLRFHSQKELGLGRRQPFKMLVAIVLFIVLMSMHPESTLFYIGAVYLLTAAVENIYYAVKKPGQKAQEAHN